ncbi:N-acetylglucosaminyl-phosphatidylinositol de-N-acetylase [Loxospora ochrophaea]|nr:N-acetylglucosaminyl-phosphatidylinositol de-N-acetylase [Loxospora ochrophaea]
MNLYLALSLPILLGTLWIYTAHVVNTSLPRLINKRICLLIAHPDDEAMFFSPTVLALTAPERGNHLKILCLSSGDADNLGHIRKKELIASAEILGLRSANDVFIIEDAKNFPDSMTLAWDAQQIAHVLASAFGSSNPQSTSTTNSRKPPTKSATNSAPASSIDILITFDAHGISGHKNHISLFHGAQAWLRSLMEGKEGWACPVDLYTLTSTNLARKYLSVFDAPFSLARCVAQGLWSRGRGKGEQLLFLSDVGGYRRAQRAMTQAHRSQMRWFRWGWIAVGRYMVVNDLRRERIV